MKPLKITPLPILSLFMFVSTASAQQYSIPSIPPVGTLEKAEYQGTPIGVLAEQFFLEDGWKTSEIYRQANDSQNLTRMTVSMCAYLDLSNNTFARFNASTTSKAYHNEGWRNQFEEWRNAHVARGAIFTPSNSNANYGNFEKRYSLKWNSEQNTCEQLRDLIFAYFEQKNAPPVQSSSSTSSASSVVEQPENNNEQSSSSSTSSSSSSHPSSSSSSSYSSSFSSVAASSAFSSVSSFSSSSITSRSSSSKASSKSSSSTSFTKAEEKALEVIQKAAEKVKNPIEPSPKTVKLIIDNHKEKPRLLTGVCRPFRNRKMGNVLERCVTRALRNGLIP